MGTKHAGVIFWVGAILIFQIVTVHCQDFKEASAACIKDKALNADQTKAVTDDSIFTAKDVPENVKCYYKCLHEKLGLVDASGNAKAEKVYQIMKDKYKDVGSKLPQILMKCAASAKSAKGCDILFQFESCAQKEAKASM